MESDAPTDLEMELRRNLSVCECSHTYMQHDDDWTNNCIVCKCRKFKEQLD